MWVIRFPYPATIPSPTPSPRAPSSKVFEKFAQRVVMCGTSFVSQVVAFGDFVSYGFLVFHIFQCQMLFQICVTWEAYKTPETHLNDKPWCYRERVRAGSLEIDNAKIILKMWSISSASWKCLTELFFNCKSFKITKFIDPDLRACG